MKRVLIVGAGLAGSVLARALAEKGVPSLVIDKHDFPAGMCHCSRDEKTGVLVHRFGPHIFHTSNERVWDFVNRFDTFVPWVNRVKAVNSRGVFSMPINLHTINQLFQTRLSPSEARSFLEQKTDRSIAEPCNAEEQLLRYVGREIYETFFKGYTMKQWGVSPRELSAGIVKRIPVRFNYDDNYYFSKYQGFPLSGYSELVRRILDHELISVGLGVSYEKSMNSEFEHVFYSGPLDGYFSYSQGELSYRTVDFEYIRGEGDLQGNGCINYTDLEVPYTRTHEHKYFSPWEQQAKSVLLREYSREAGRDDNPFYPKRMQADMEVLKRYMPLVDSLEGVSFIGRLGCYRYLDMHDVIRISLEYADHWADWKNGREDALQVMAVSPLN